MKVVASLSLLATMAYACEVPPCSKCTSQTIDMHLALDHSGSIGSTNWVKMKAFSTAFVEQVGGEFFEPWFGVSRFSGTSASYLGGIDQSMTVDQNRVLQVIANTPAQPSGFTPTPDGIKKGGADLINNGRAGTNKILVLVTDGVPRDQASIFPLADSTDQATLLKDQGILVITVGVNLASAIASERAGAYAVINECASKPSDVFAIPDVSDFDKLSTEVIPRLLGLLCTYVSTVKTLGCLLSNEERTLEIDGDGFFAVSSTPKCRIRPRELLNQWTEFPATFASTSQARCAVTATKVGQWTIEISRDGGFSWTENGAYFSVADVCGSNIDNGLTPDGTIDDTKFIDFDDESSDAPQYINPDTGTSDEISAASSLTAGLAAVLSFLLVISL